MEKVRYSITKGGKKFLKSLKPGFDYDMHYLIFFLISGDTRRKKKLLMQINDLQEWQQSGIPIVYRFLAEYISTRWNGSDFFLEIMRLLVYLPITEFEGKKI